MTSVHLYNETDHLLLTKVQVPRYTVFQRRVASSQNGSGDDEWRPLADDEGVVSVMSAVALQVARARFGPDDAQWESFDLDTWIWRPRPDGTDTLNGWYADSGSLHDYRVCMHHTPRRLGSFRLPLLWDEAYTVAQGMSRGRLAVLEVSPEAVTAGSAMLASALAAYREPEGRVEALVSSFGHPYLQVRSRSGS